MTSSLANKVVGNGCSKAIVPILVNNSYQGERESKWEYFSLLCAGELREIAPFASFLLVIIDLLMCWSFTRFKRTYIALKFLSMLEYEHLIEIHGFVHPHYHNPTRELPKTACKYHIQSRNTDKWCLRGQLSCVSVNKHNQFFWW